MLSILNSRLRLLIDGVTPGGFLSDATLPLDTWTHVAGVYDGLNAHLYINGSLEASVTARGSIPTSDRPLTIGANAALAYGGTHFNGLIDEAAVFNRALSADEIAFIYDQAAAGKTKDQGNTSGIRIEQGATNNNVGGTTEAARNVISGNTDAGVVIASGAIGNVLQGNTIGTNASGDAAVPNHTGIVLGSPDNTVGGTSAGAANVISGNVVGLRVGAGSYSPTTQIHGNRVGTNLAGDAAIPNFAGIVIDAGATGVLVGGTVQGTGNLISGNSGTGVTINGSENTVEGNSIGTTLDGMSALGNGWAGVFVDNGADNLIGGAEAAARNVISGNATGMGVYVFGPLATGNQVAGNFVGVGRDGATDLGNSRGVAVGGDHGHGFGAPGNLIGGTTEAERNVISGNYYSNVSLGRTLGTTVQGNIIGMDWTGTLSLERTRIGVSVYDDRNSLIGGVEPGAGNLVAGCLWNVYVAGRWVDGGSVGTRVQGNRIGMPFLDNQWGVYVDAHDQYHPPLEVNDILIGGSEPGAGNQILGNWKQQIMVRGPNAHNVTIQGNTIGPDEPNAYPYGDGVLVEDASGVVIGGTESGQANTIAFNPGAGVIVTGENSVGNSIRGNSIFDNGGLGIDLGGDGITRNDIRDLDTGPNDQQNIPQISLAETGSRTRVAGVLHSMPSSSFTVDFYTITERDPSGHGEGRRWLDEAVVATDANGYGSWDVVLDAVTVEGELITATATNAIGSTSEFSQSISDDVPANTLVVTNTNDSGIGSLRQAIVAANQIPGSDPVHIWFRLHNNDPRFLDIDSHLPGGDTLPDVYRFSPLSALPPLTRGNVSIDGESQFRLSGRGKNPFGPMIVLSGSEITSTANGLHLDSGGNHVHGLTIQQFAGAGILVTGEDNTITGSFIGTSALGDASGAALPGIVGWWPGEGTADDIAGNHDGTLMNGTTFASGIVGQAFSFDGVDDYVDVGPGNDLDAMTLESWVFIDPPKNTGEQRVISRDNYRQQGVRKAFALKTSSPYVSGQHGRATFGVLVYGDSRDIDVIEASSPLTAGWHHLAGVRDTDAGRFELYVDGELVASKTPTVFGVIDSDVNTVIGRVSATSGLEHYDGLIDEPTIYDRGLSAEEVEFIFNQGSTGKGTGNPANDGNGIHILDSSDNLIGGTTEAARNVISGNNGSGIQITRGSQNVIQGNYIGTDVTGTVAMGNEGNGIWLVDSSNTLIGGTTAAERNIISGNAPTGIVIDGALCTGNTIVGNYIGTDVTGTANLGNRSDGVAIMG
jgi:hypothetical protein